MAVETIEPSDFDEAIAVLTALTDEFPTTEFIFRGQEDSEWRLQTSYDRYWGGRPLHDEFFVEKMVAQFRSGVTQLGLEAPVDGNLDWLEYGRHHGLPSPLLDFTWSPFVALFFAFDGIRSNTTRCSAVYCLNLNQLAKEVAREHVGDMHAFRQAMVSFLHEGALHFEEGYPMDKLVFLRYPNAHTRRMHVQLGTFLYSTIQFIHDAPEPNDLEGYFEHMEEGFDSPSLPNVERPVLLKMKLPHSWASKVFRRLEIMGISGSSMYMTAEGVAKDVYNDYVFNRRSAYLRDI